MLSSLCLKFLQSLAMWNARSEWRPFLVFQHWAFKRLLSRPAGTVCNQIVSTTIYSTGENWLLLAQKRPSIHWFRNMFPFSRFQYVMYTHWTSPVKNSSTSKRKHMRFVCFQLLAIYKILHTDNFREKENSGITSLVATFACYKSFTEIFKKLW